MVTVIFASEPLTGGYVAEEWLADMADEATVDAVLDQGFAVLNRALAGAAGAAGRVVDAPVSADSPVTARIGFGDGDQVAAGRHLEAVEIDVRGGTAGPRRERQARVSPLARIAAILGDREPLFACEVLVPRVRADLDAGRDAAAALTIESAARATLIELEFSLEGPEHENDLDRLEQLLPDLARLTENALEPGPEPVGTGETPPGPADTEGEQPGLAGPGLAQPKPAGTGDERPDRRSRIEAALTVAERVLRRHRINSQ